MRCRHPLLQFNAQTRTRTYILQQRTLRAIRNANLTNSTVVGERFRKTIRASSARNVYTCNHPRSMCETTKFSTRITATVTYALLHLHCKKLINSTIRVAILIYITMRVLVRIGVVSDFLLLLFFPPTTFRNFISSMTV